MGFENPDMEPQKKEKNISRRGDEWDARSLDTAS